MTAAAAASPRRRQARLLAAIRTHGGEWTTRRVMALYGPAVPCRSTARGDLAALARAGLLTLHDTANRRYFTLPAHHATGDVA